LQLVKTAMKQTIRRQSLWNDLSQARAKHASVSTSEKEGYSPTEIRHLVAVCFWQALDEAMQAQASKVIGHLPGSQMVWGDAQEGRKQRPEIMAGESLRREKAKDNQCTQQSLHPCVCEAQRRHPLSGEDLRLVELLKSVLPQKAILAERLDVQKTSVGLEADLPQSGQVLRWKSCVPLMVVPVRKARSSLWYCLMRECL
jgi:hypothetical protein